MTCAVVVGSGIAGITAALHAAEAGATVTLVTKGALDEANTTFAQGGIAAVTFDDDCVGDHVRDTLDAGARIGDPAAAEVLAASAASRIDELVARGVAFDRDADGHYVKGLEAAHSYPRILHAGGDATGRIVESALTAALDHSDVEVVTGAFLLELLMTDASPRRVTGVRLLHDGVEVDLPADAVVLATGGAGQLYPHTTNPVVATGDGIAAALRAGAEIADLEFVQFHPTVLGAVRPFLISEAVRGEGAAIRDRDGRRFLFDIHPDGELAPRDVVARAISRRAGEQAAPVTLDATGLFDADPAVRARRLAGRFPTIDAAVRAAGFDWAREPVPVTPAAHYLMGGIVTDLEGRTNLPGLYAVGECARTGVHGANRLASNSLLEAAVFAARAGDALVHDTPAPSLNRREWSCAPQADASRGTTPLSTGATDVTGEAGFTRRGLQDLMWREAGLRRDAEGLRHAAGILTAWAARVRTPHTVADAEDQNLLTVARALVDAALARPHSVGAHFRTDDPAHALPPIAAEGRRSDSARPDERRPDDALLLEAH